MYCHRFQRNRKRRNHTSNLFEGLEEEEPVKRIKSAQNKQISKPATDENKKEEPDSFDDVFAEFDNFEDFDL